MKVNPLLLIGGIFMIYLSAANEALFDVIFDAYEKDRTTNTIATTVAAALPMFFATGLIKNSLKIGWFTVYYYEKFIEKKAFLVVTTILLLVILALNSMSYPEISGGCIITIVIIWIGDYIERRRKKHY